MASDDRVTRYISQLRRGPVVAACAVAAALFLLYIPVFAHAVELWSVDEEFSFGFLIPLITIGLFWMRRRQLRESVARGSLGGLALMGIGAIMLLIDTLSDVRAIGGASFAFTFVGAIIYLYGWKAGQLSIFPLAFLAFALSMYRGLLNSVGFFLQNLTAQYSAKAATLVGVPVRRQGVDLFAPGGFHFIVAEACSGMSSLLALLCLGSLIVGLSRTTLPRRMLMILFIPPIVITANIVRVTLVVTLSQVFGMAVTESFIHGMFSATLFLIALTLYYVVGRMLKMYPSLASLI